MILGAIRHLREEGFDIVAAVLLGGGEKLSGPPDLGSIPIVLGDGPLDATRRALAEFVPEVALDVSDDPVVDQPTRLALAAACLAAGVAYQGADFRFDPPKRPRLATKPSLAVIGTGKRCGKTAVAAHIARVLTDEGFGPVMVAMGRGGPEHPRVVRGDERPLSAADLLAVADAGEHAASDVYEDAVMARVPVVGARRAGAGMAGAPVVDNVAEAVRVANDLPGDLMILEGSGTAIPPVACDATVLVVGAGGTKALEGLGIIRVLPADLVVATMLGEQSVSVHTLSALTSLLREQAQSAAYVGTAFRPTPIGPVAGRRVLVATTAPHSAGDALRVHLQDVHGAHVVGVTHNLGDRTALEEDLAGMAGTYDVLVTELKAAAVDVAARRAIGSGAEVVFLDNRPVAVDGNLTDEVLGAATKAVERFRRARGGSREQTT